MGEERASTALRVGHLLRIQSYLGMAILSMWQASPRASAIVGMARASLRGEGPGGNDGETLGTLRTLIEEAAEYYEDGDFPAAMTRMRVANDLTAFHIIEIAGE